MSTEWHRWYAWRPVRLVYEINEYPGFSYVDSGNYAWFRWIERRLRLEMAPYEGHSWEYREPPFDGQSPREEKL